MLQSLILADEHVLHQGRQNPITHSHIRSSGVIRGLFLSEALTKKIRGSQIRFSQVRLLHEYPNFFHSTFAPFPLQGLTVSDLNSETTLLCRLPFDWVCSFYSVSEVYVALAL